MLKHPLIEFSYKNDELGDPLIIEDYAIIWLGYGRKIRKIKKSHCAKETLKEFFLNRGVNLVDFKLAFGKDSSGNIILADEISPDTCRFWDSSTGNKLDKDRFRKDLGTVLDAYREIWKRISE